MVQRYKNESKSQRCRQTWTKQTCCDVWYKGTKMRANHNQIINLVVSHDAVTYGTKVQK